MDSGKRVLPMSEVLFYRNFLYMCFFGEKWFKKVTKFNLSGKLKLVYT